MDAKLSNDNNECIAKNKWLTISEKKIIPYRFSKEVCNQKQEYHKLMEILKKLLFLIKKIKAGTCNSAILQILHVNFGNQLSVIAILTKLLKSSIHANCSLK